MLLILMFFDINTNNKNLEKSYKKYKSFLNDVHIHRSFHKIISIDVKNLINKNPLQPIQKACPKWSAKINPLKLRPIISNLKNASLIIGLVCVRKPIDWGLLRYYEV
jgi:hypothetical protein